MSALRRRLATFAATVLVATPVVAVGSSHAAFAGCPPETTYRLSASSIRMPVKGIPTFRDGRGGEIEVSRSFSGETSFQVTAGAETEAGAILAKAKVSVSASLTRTTGKVTSHTYRHTISRGKFGNARYVTYGKRIKWAKYRTMPTCKTTRTASGTINFPTRTVGWYYWETNS